VADNLVLLRAGAARKTVAVHNGRTLGTAPLPVAGAPVVPHLVPPNLRKIAVLAPVIPAGGVTNPCADHPHPRHAATNAVRHRAHIVGGVIRAQENPARVQFPASRRDRVIRIMVVIGANKDFPQPMQNAVVTKIKIRAGKNGMLHSHRGAIQILPTGVVVVPPAIHRYLGGIYVGPGPPGNSDDGRRRIADAKTGIAPHVSLLGGTAKINPFHPILEADPRPELAVREERGACKRSRITHHGAQIRAGRTRVIIRP